MPILKNKIAWGFGASLCLPSRFLCVVYVLVIFFVFPHFSFAYSMQTEPKCARFFVKNPYPCPRAMPPPRSTLPHEIRRKKHPASSFPFTYLLLAFLHRATRAAQKREKIKIKTKYLHIRNIILRSEFPFWSNPRTIKYSGSSTSRQGILYKKAMALHLKGDA